MTRRLSLTLLAVSMAFGFLAADAHAQNKPKKGTQEVEELTDWTGLDVGAKVLRPRGDSIVIGTPDTGASLLYIRPDFVDELIRSAEDL